MFWYLCKMQRLKTFKICICFLSVSQSCHNKAPQTRWLTTTEVFHLSSRGQQYDIMVLVRPYFLQALKGSFLVSSSFCAPRHSLAGGSLTPISASISTKPSSHCVCLHTAFSHGFVCSKFSFLYKNTCHIETGPTLMTSSQLNYNL